MDAKIGIFPGSFDPITKGHEYVINKAATMVDELIVGIGENSTKKYLFSLDQRLKWIEKTFEGNPKIKVQSYNGLTIDFAKSVKADIIFRGLRSGVDFEYEKPIAETNQLLNSSINTVFLLTHKEFGMISSSIVREIIKNNGNANSFIPDSVTI